MQARRDHGLVEVAGGAGLVVAQMGAVEGVAAVGVDAGELDLFAGAVGVFPWAGGEADCAGELVGAGAEAFEAGDDVAVRFEGPYFGLGLPVVDGIGGSDAGGADDDEVGDAAWLPHGQSGDERAVGVPDQCEVEVPAAQAVEFGYEFAQGGHAFFGASVGEDGGVHLRASVAQPEYCGEAFA